MPSAKRSSRDQTLHGSSAYAFSERVERAQRIAAESPDLISLAGGLPDAALFPRRELSRGFRRALGRSDGRALQYGWPEGQLSLRRWIAARLCARGAAVSAEHVLITNGAQQAITLLSELLFLPGQRVAVDPETYPGALDTFRSRGLVPSSELEHAAGFYVMPSVSNPRGHSANAAARTRLLTRARQLELPILEDDAYAETVFDGAIAPPLLAQAPERVFHIGTFSKTLCPGLRVGWLVAPERHLPALLRAKRDSDLQANSLAQALLAEYLSSEGAYDAHLAQSQRTYARRAARLAEALRKFTPELRFSFPIGGFSLWLESDRAGDDEALLEHAIRAGTSFDPGSCFRATRGGPLALRLCFSAQRDAELDEAAKRLARALRSFSA